MLPSNRTELLEELNATDETYVKKKLALGGYDGWQKPVAQHWLDERTLARQAATQRSSVMWLRLRVGLAGLGVIAPIIWGYFMR